MTILSKTQTALFSKIINSIETVSIHHLNICATLDGENINLGTVKALIRKGYLIVKTSDHWLTTYVADILNDDVDAFINAEVEADEEASQEMARIFPTPTVVDSVIELIELIDDVETPADIEITSDDLSADQNEQIALYIRNNGHMGIYGTHSIVKTAENNVVAVLGCASVSCPLDLGKFVQVELRSYAGMIATHRYNWTVTAITDEKVLYTFSADDMKDQKHSMDKKGFLSCILSGAIKPVNKTYLDTDSSLWVSDCGQYKIKASDNDYYMYALFLNGDFITNGDSQHELKKLVNDNK